MRLYAIPNLSASTASEQLPWEVRTKFPKKLEDAGKPAFIDWCTTPVVKHCFFSAFEGLTPSLRVSSGSNPPAVLHGLVADYDTTISETLWSGLSERSKSEFMPTHGSSTYSGGARLVWEFEEPLVLSSRAVTQKFLNLAAKELGLSKLLPGFDVPAFLDPEKYYELGRDWKVLSSDKIPSALLWLWMARAGDRVKEKVQVRIPMEDIEARVNELFPGRWTGPFEVGARGVRFWDDGADNRTAAVVRENGMQCFTGASGFVSWQEIFGQAWVRRYEEESVGTLMQDWWYDGTHYWSKDAESHSWIRVSRDDFKLMCKVRYGMSGKTRSNENASEIDTLCYRVQSLKRVEGAFPRVHCPEGPYVEQGRRFLNTCSIRCLNPATECSFWGDGFPWLARFFDEFFCSPEQKDAFLAWLHWFYLNGYLQTPKGGQAIFIAGDKGIGKTLLSNGIVSRMVGGHQDAREFLLGTGSSFTDYILESPLLTMDDAEPVADSRMQTKFSNNVKRMVANPYHHYDRKFRDSGQTLWLGRIIVTCNLDPESLRILPSLELSNREKVSMFRARGGDIEFLPFQELQGLLDEELPFFARWLLDWRVPAQFKGTARFGTQAYHDPLLDDAATQSETSYAFRELLDEFRIRFWKFSKEDYWTGSSTMLLTALVGTPDLEAVARPFTDVRAISRNLGKLAARGNAYVEMVPGSGQKVWKIKCDPSTWPELLRNQNED